MIFATRVDIVGSVVSGGGLYADIYYWTMITIWTNDFCTVEKMVFIMTVGVGQVAVI